MRQSSCIGRVRIPISLFGAFDVHGCDWMGGGFFRDLV